MYKIICQTCSCIDSKAPVTTMLAGAWIDDLIIWNASWVTGPLWGESTGNRWMIPPVTGGFPSQRASYMGFDVSFDVSLNKLLNKQWNFQSSQTPWCSCDATIMTSDTVASDAEGLTSDEKKKFLCLKSLSVKIYQCCFNTLRLRQNGRRDKMAANFLTTFSNGFSWMKMCEFRSKLP